jgi:hypothetical protein
MREHIYRTIRNNFVVFIEHLQVARLGGAVATYVYQFWRRYFYECLYNVGVHTCAWRVNDDYVGFAVLIDEIELEYILHVASEKFGIVYIVNLRIDFCIFYRLWYVLNTDNFFASACYEICYGACACV